MPDIFSYPASLTLIVLNVFASLIAFRNQAFNEQNILWVGPMQEAGEWHRLISSGFLHVNGPHLVLNMYGLFMFGPVIEHYLGGVNFLIIYIASLIGGSVWAYVWNKNNPQYRAAGASGALSGIILAFCLIDPFSVLLFLFVIPMWGIVFGIAFVVLSYVFSQRANRVIGHEAHLGGAVTGIVTTLLVAPQVWTHFLLQISQKFG
ncbi:rhomboid family intramembrane serine protease [Hyphomonas sp. WL0036]|uniref:rhomboid family intramembrane serine protease n=1 Tax=Hyphomonas sediminis TaxID=2866160 RepID=UPI001C81F142|nr:rhomboid family intramembrane serine protease [Hyphomonas sediminis]MBY9065688.1 rhomboid family intramembrane serine protease [Hyphomonas sediminis]